MPSKNGKVSANNSRSYIPWGIIIVLTAIFLLVALFSYSPADFNPVMDSGHKIVNAGGLIGAYAGRALYYSFGLGAVFVPLLMLIAGVRLVFKSLNVPLRLYMGTILLWLCFISGFAHPYITPLFSYASIRGGGVVGAGLYAFLNDLIGAGFILLLALALLVCVKLLTNATWQTMLEKTTAFIALFRVKRDESAVDRQTKALRSDERSSVDDGEEAEPAQAEKAGKGGILSGLRKHASFSVIREDMGTPPDAREDADDSEQDQDRPKPQIVFYAGDTPEVTSVPSPVPTPLEPRPTPAAIPAGLPEKKEPVKKAAPGIMAGENLPLPKSDLMAEIEAVKQDVDMSDLEKLAGALTICLADFSVNGKVTRIVPGPVVTMYEFEPDKGVKISRISGLSHDIARVLKASAVRVIAPLPNKDTVGIEIPNRDRKTVYYRELLESDAFIASKSRLTLILGKDAEGRPKIADLAKMPHLLVAGATGAGKSVCLNGIILSFLFKARPDEVKLLLVDPKRIELSVYENLPHLVHPVVTDMSHAKNALDWAVYEMDRRYEAMARIGVRNLDSYNQKIKENRELPDDGNLAPMPYLVIIIDELADLMLTAGKDVETAIVRLAQLARAAGIHMILATQRPSVDVVTGLIKANFPCRIAFQVTSRHDSRTILDAIGAELLLGRGDMLFKPGAGKLERAHGAFVSDEDTAKVVGYWKSIAAPNFDLDFGKWKPQEDSGDDQGFDPADPDGEDDNDPIYEQAVDFVYGQGKASISLIQRRFKIGFNRAARYVERMEKEGIIGSADGSKPRLVLKPRT